MPTPTSLETLFLQLINESRAKVGSKPLTVDGELLTAARSHSDWMDTTDTFSHTGVNGSTPGDRIAAAGYGAQGWGENIAYVSGGLTETAVRQLHANLMNSPGHRANIERGTFEEIGIGLDQGTINGHTVLFVTQAFGTPNAQERAEPDDVGTTPATSTTVSDSTIYGTGGNDLLQGTSGNDIIQGLGGSDRIEGRAGSDILTGGTGQDAFVFNTALSASTNVDTIQDFNVYADTIWLENAVFTALTSSGTLSWGSFYKGAVAHDSTDRIMYDSATGALTYDADGNGAGSAVKFAQVAKGLALTNNDFIVV